MEVSFDAAARFAGSPPYIRSRSWGLHPRLYAVVRSAHSSRYRLICYLQTLIDNRKRLAHFILGDAQGWIGEEGVPTHEGVEPLLAEVSAERLHLWRSAIERRHRFEGLAITDQFEDAK